MTVTLPPTRRPFEYRTDDAPHSPKPYVPDLRDFPAQRSRYPIYMALALLGVAFALVVISATHPTLLGPSAEVGMSLPP